MGWDKEVLEKLKNKHKWRDEAVARLKFLHDEYKILKNKNEETDRYRKALEEIEGMLQVIVKSNKVYPLQSNLYKILNIISKAKGEE